MVHKRPVRSSLEECRKACDLTRGCQGVLEGKSGAWTGTCLFVKGNAGRVCVPNPKATQMRYHACAIPPKLVKRYKVQLVAQSGWEETYNAMKVINGQYLTLREARK